MLPFAALRHRSKPADRIPVPDRDARGNHLADAAFLLFHPASFQANLACGEVSAERAFVLMRLTKLRHCQDSQASAFGAILRVHWSGLEVKTSAKDFQLFARSGEPNFCGWLQQRAQARRLCPICLTSFTEMPSGHVRKNRSSLFEFEGIGSLSKKRKGTDTGLTRTKCLGRDSPRSQRCPRRSSCHGRPPGIWYAEIDGIPRQKLIGVLAGSFEPIATFGLSRKGSGSETLPKQRRQPMFCEGRRTSCLYETSATPPAHEAANGPAHLPPAPQHEVSAPRQSVAGPHRMTMRKGAD